MAGTATNVSYTESKTNVISCVRIGVAALFGDHFVSKKTIRTANLSRFQLTGPTMPSG